MAWLESVSGFRELFTDPPEFEILHVNQRQKISNFIRIILGGIALLLLAIQSSCGPISCTFVQNSTLSKGATNDYILDSCLDDIKENSGNNYLILDEYFGWFLSLEIICLMLTTKFIARTQRNKEICRRFTELYETVQHHGSGENDDEENEFLINENRLVKDFSMFMVFLRKNSILGKTHYWNCVCCIIISSLFCALGMHQKFCLTLLPLKNILRTL